jgi:hypothetical protein
MKVLSSNSSKIILFEETDTTITRIELKRENGTWIQKDLKIGTK